MFYKMMRVFAYILFNSIYLIFVRGGVRFEGQENVPKEGGVLITPNHQSFMDPPTVGVACPRYPYVMAMDWLFKIPVIGQCIAWLRGFPVKAGTADRTSLKYAEDRLKEGECVIIFPEGTVSKDTALLPMKPGVMMLASRANVPIVPTIIEGTQSLMAYEKAFPRFSKMGILVRFGKPLTIEQLCGGLRGSAGYHLGAERLFLAMQAVRENRPYPDMPPAEKEVVAKGATANEETVAPEPEAEPIEKV